MELKVTELACARGGITVLSGVSFTVRAGEALVLRGPNGIGKTTLLRTLVGLQPAISGQVSLPSDIIAYAGHADGVKPTLTVAENLAFWASAYGTSGSAVALSALDLGDLVDRPAAQLSAGQKRRLGLARLLVTGRRVWVLDEPTVSLDAASVALFVAALRAHLASGGMALAATHIDLGLDGAQVLDLSPFRAAPGLADIDEAFG